MSTYIAPFTFDFVDELILVDVGTTSIDIGTLYEAIKAVQATVEGELYAPIAQGSGRVSLGSGVAVGLTVLLLESWQVKFAAGTYIAKISGGNLVGGPGGDPVAYSAGVQVQLTLSAASTVVSTGDALAQIAADTAASRALAEADLVYDHEAGLLHTYQRGTTTDLIPPKTVAGTTQPTDSSLVTP
jgi:hypothetical protein